MEKNNVPLSINNMACIFVLKLRHHKHGKSGGQSVKVSRRCESRLALFIDIFTKLKLVSRDKMGKHYICRAPKHFL
jgi:hypothetical protein